MDIFIMIPQTHIICCFSCYQFPSSIFQSSHCEKNSIGKFHLAYLCRIPESIPQNRMWPGISTCPTTSAGCMSYKQQF